GKGYGLSTTAGMIYGGKNSGYQAIGLAHQMGASRILLLGYEMNPKAEKLHFFGEHSVAAGLTNPTHIDMKRWRAYMGILAEDLEEIGISVVNCSSNTALKCFARGEINDELRYN